jgi:hypothetical protein
MERSGQEYPQHVQRRHGDEQVGAPVMHAAYEPAKQDFLLHEQDGLVGAFRGWFVDKNHQQPGTYQQHKEHQGHATEAESMCVPQGSRRYANGSRMQYQGVCKGPLALVTAPGKICLIFLHSLYRPTAIRAKQESSIPIISAA